MTPVALLVLGLLGLDLLVPGPLGPSDGAHATEALSVPVVAAPVTPAPVAAAPSGSVRAAGTLRVDAGPDAVLTVDATRLVRGTLELPADREVVINELDLEDYVAGVAEMPSRWHPEALRAQAIAARTYAWYVSRTAAYEGYDICATVACQVYRGVEVERDESGGPTRWRQAVDDTAGQVLVGAEGAPILARYFSTSGGRTYANEEAFPSQGPRPYLVSIDDPYDAVSPYHRWQVRFTRAEFDDILSRGETLAATVPVAGVARRGAVDDPGAVIEVTGQDGTVVDVDARRFADFVSRVAPGRFPDRFPTAREDGLRPLPSTVPSSRFRPEVTDAEVVLHGQGWGHGVGLGQYGARGRADAGADHREILAAYYDGLAPTTTDALPSRIRVGWSVGDEVRLAADRPLVLRDDAGLERRVLGTWTATRIADGWELTPPAGHDDPVVAAPTTVLPGLTSPTLVVVETEVAQPVILDLEVVDDAGSLVLLRSLGSVDPGRHTTAWDLTDGEGDTVPPGRYALTLIAEDAAGRRAGSATEVEVAATSGLGQPGQVGLEPDAGGTHGDPRLGRVPLALAGALAAGLLVAAAGARHQVRRR